MARSVLQGEGHPRVPSLSTSPSPPALVSPLALIGDPSRGPVEAIRPGSLVEAVNSIARGEGLVAALDLAECLLDAFFDGEPATWRDEGGAHPGFRAFLREPDLEPSAATVWYALGVWEQYHALPREIADGLSLAHHRALLPVRAPDRKLALARAAARHGWSKRRLEREVRALSDEPGRGRPRKPGFVRAAARVREGLAEGIAAAPTPEEIRRHGVRETRRTLKALRDDLQALSALAEGWEAALRETAEAD